jgi:hypothetical protein
MAPGSVDVPASAPQKNRVIISDKCSKCNRTVKNGVLCDSCDRWVHFKCGKIDDKDKIDETTEWLCPTCISMDGSMMAEQQSDHVSEVNYKEIVAILQNDLKELQNEYEKLKNAVNNSSKCCGNSCFNHIPETQTSRPTPDRWERVPTKKSSKFKTNMESLKEFPPLPLKNRYESLAINSDGENSMPTEKQQNTQINLTVMGSNQGQKPRNTHKIRLFTDSQGRLLTNELRASSKNNVSCMLKPGAKFDAVTEEAKAICANMGKKDIAVFIGGTNDVSCNETTSLIRSLKRRLQDTRHTNVLVFNVPHRHDLPSWSCVNKEVKRANEMIDKVCSHFENVKTVDISRLGARFHTKHGLHLNKQGKMYIVDKILNFVSSIENSGETIKQPIALAYDRASFLGLP